MNFQPVLNVYGYFNIFNMRASIFTIYLRKKKELK